MKVTAAPKQSVQFVKEARDELRKVNWPSREQTIRYTGIVIVACLVVSAIIGAVDYLLSIILERTIL